MDTFRTFLEGITLTTSPFERHERAIQRIQLGMRLRKFPKPSTQFDDLPPELRTKIFNMLPAKSAKTCRQVSSQWRDLVDSTYRFSVLINNTQFANSEIPFPPWKIRACSISHYRSEDTSAFLQYPFILKKLHVFGSISKECFHGLVRSCVNLEEIYMAKDFVNNECEPIGISRDFEGYQDIKLQKLKKVTIYCRHSSVNIHNNPLCFLMQNCTSLTKLRLSVDQPVCEEIPGDMTPEEVQMASELAIFIAKQRFLKDLHLSISYLSYNDQGTASSALQLLQTKIPLYAKQLGEIELDVCKLRVAPLYITLLQPLIESQSSLMEFRLQGRYFSAMPLRYELIENPITRGVQNLVSVHVEWLSKFPAHPMTTINFGVFREAKCLQRLVLRRWWPTATSGDNGMARIVNLHCLPAPLNLLVIEGFICSSEDLILTATSFKQLSEVRILYAGMFGHGVGITGAVVKAFCFNETLDLLDLGPLRNAQNEREDREYAQLQRMFPYHRFDSEIPDNIVRLDLHLFRLRERARRTQEELELARQRRRLLCSCIQ